MGKFFLSLTDEGGLSHFCEGYWIAFAIGVSSSSSILVEFELGERFVYFGAERAYPELYSSMYAISKKERSPKLPLIYRKKNHTNGLS